MKVSIPARWFIHSPTNAAFVEDFGIERHGFHLPPPFYPSSHPIHQSNISPALNGQYNAPQDPYQGFINESSYASGLTFTSPELPTFHTNPTPPVDDTSSPISSSYQGYGHIPYVGFQAQPTPPAETSPCPTEASCHPHNQLPHTSFQEEHLHSASFHSFYQGYSYGNTQPVFPPSAGSATSQHTPAQSEYKANTNARDVFLASSFSDQVESQIPDMMLEKYQGEEPRGTTTPLEIISHELTHPNNINLLYSTGACFEFRYQSPSQSTENHEESRSVASEDREVTEQPAAKPKDETWTQDVSAKLDQAARMEALPVRCVVRYLTQQFNRTEHADYHLIITNEIYKLQIVDFWLHGLLIAQSPVLRELIKSSGPHENSVKSLQLQTKDRFITPLAIEAALRSCYGKPITDFKCSPLDTPKSNIEVSVSWMENCLAVIASGNLLGLPEVSSWGLYIAKSVLNWKNIEKAISFALQGRLSLESRPDTTGAATTENSSFLSDDSTNILTTSSSSEHMISDYAGSNIGSEDPFSEALHGISSPDAKDLLLRCVDFIVKGVPKDWKLDLSARPLADIDRLPVVPGSRSPLVKSRLSRIQFGDHPSENAAKSSDENITLSSLLLSLPFATLKHILDRLDEPTRCGIVEQIIDERERRRRQAVTCESVAWSQRQAAATDWTQAGWEEFVTPEGTMLTLRRKWVGFQRPSNNHRVESLRNSGQR